MRPIFKLNFLGSKFFKSLYYKPPQSKSMHSISAISASTSLPSVTFPTPLHYSPKYLVKISEDLCLSPSLLSSHRQCHKETQRRAPSLKRGAWLGVLQPPIKAQNEEMIVRPHLYMCFISTYVSLCMCVLLHAHVYICEPKCSGYSREAFTPNCNSDD